MVKPPSALAKAFPFTKEAHIFAPMQLRHKNTWRAAGRSMRDSAMGNSIFLPVFAYLASKEEPGEKLAGFAPEMIGIGANTLLSPAVTLCMSAFIPGFSALPVGARSMIGMLTSAFVLNAPITEKMGLMIRRATKATYQKRSLEMGGNFRDSASAANQRAAALQEMSSAFGSSRRYLGREALLLHG